jgi:ATP-dependent Lhr-like helicase
MNIGTIIDTETLKVRLKNRGGGAPLGEIEEGFAASLVQGDTFLIGGQIVMYDSLKDMTVQVTRDASKTPKIATFSGTKFATSTQLSERLLTIFQQVTWPDLPAHTSQWLALQRERSKLPEPGRLLIESFPHQNRNYSVIYGFAGRNAQQTLGLLLTQRMEEQGLDPLGFLATDYATMIWGLRPLTDPTPLFAVDNLREGLSNWLAGNAVMKRTFRACAIIGGLIDRLTVGKRKSGRQATFSSDILYDTLRKYDPEHVMLDITREEAMKGLIDFGRIEDMVRKRAKHIDLITLDRVTPLAAPLLLELGRVPVKGRAEERLLEEAAADMMSIAGLN